jgi:hypothetical protein
MDDTDRRVTARRNELRLVPSPLRRFFEQAPELRPLTLRFVDPGVEAGFQDAYFRDNLSYIRLAHVLGVAIWAPSGFWPGGHCGSSAVSTRSSGSASASPRSCSASR